MLKNAIVFITWHFVLKNPRKDHKNVKNMAQEEQ